MSDRLKLSDAKGEAEVARVAVAQELMEDHKRIKELEENIAALEAELAKQKRNVPATAAPKKNKIGARKQASFMAISTAPSINKTPIGPSMVRWSSKSGHNNRFTYCHFPFIDGGRQIAQC